MIRSRRQLIGIFVVASLVLMGVFALLVRWHQETFIDDLVYQAHGEVVVGLADRVGEAIHLGNFALAEMLVQQHLQVAPQFLWAQVTGPEGSVEFATDPHTTIPQNRQRLYQFSAPMALSGNNVTMSVSHAAGADELVYQLPLVFKGQPLGAMTLGVAKSYRDRVVKAGVHQFVMYGVFLLILCLITIGLASRSITDRRLADVVATTRYLAHDLKKPFTQIEAFLSSLGRLPPERLRAYGQKIQPDLRQSYDHVCRLLDEIMALDKREPSRLGAADLEETLQQALRLATLQQVPPKPVTVTWDLEVCDAVKGVPDRLVRVFVNLIGNALDATESHGHIHFTAKEVGFWGRRRIEVTVHNTGSYIPRCQRRRIFRPFVTQGTKSGAGLGLAFCKQFLKDLGGSIRCRSHPTRGTTFLVRLPVAASKSVETVPDNVIALASRSKRLQEHRCEFGERGKWLFVDDDPWVRAVWQACDPSVPVLTLATGVELDRLVKEEAISVIVLDYYLESGEKNGLQLAKEIRRKGFRGPIFLCSEQLPDEVDLQEISGVVPKLPAQARPLIEKYLSKHSSPD